MKITTLFVATIGFLASSAQAADWKLAGVSDSSYAYVDVSSIVTMKSNRKAWVMWSDIDPEGRPSSGATPASRSSKVLGHYNCAERSTAMAQRISYAGLLGEGETLHSAKYPLTPSSFAEVVPESMGELVFNYVCSRKFK